MHSAPAIKWSDGVAQSAQEYATQTLINGALTHSDSYSLAAPAGPAGENLASYSAAQSAELVVKAWYDEVANIETFEPFKCKDGKLCEHFTALVWTGVKEIGCGCVKATTGNQIYICRYKSGDSLDMEVANMEKPDNFPAHVKQLNPAAPKPKPTPPAASNEEVPDPNKVVPVQVRISLNDGPFMNAQITWNLEKGSFSFSYNGKSHNIEGVDVNPIFTDSGLFDLENYVAFYEGLGKKYPDGKWANLAGFIQFHATQANAEKGHKTLVFEYFVKKADSSDLTIATLTMSEKNKKEFLKGITKVIERDIKAEDIDIRKDVRVLAAVYPFKVSARLGGETFVSMNLNIGDEGKVTLEKEDGSTATVIPSVSAYVKHCRFRYNDANKFNDKSVKYRPECCLHFTTQNDQEEYICSTLGDYCRYEALSMLKKLKLACEKEGFEPLTTSLDLPNLIEMPVKPVSPVYPFYTVPRDKSKAGNAAMTAFMNSPQGRFDAKFTLKEIFYNIPDDGLQFTVFSESDFKKYGDMVVPKFLTVETITLKEGRISIDFKDSEKKYVRNLANVRVYNHQDPDALDDTPEEVNGAIFDALNYYNYMKNRVFHSDLLKLNKFKAIMFRLLGAPNIYNAGFKCNVVEFENPMNTRQEVMFLCYCNPTATAAKCTVLEYDNEVFNSEFTDQVRSSYYHANLSTDVRLLRNSVPIPIKYWRSDVPADNSEHKVHYDDKGVKDIATNLYLFEFKDIDDSPQDPTNRCLIYFNNHEEVPAFKSWHSETGEKRECCHRFFSNSKAIQHYVCVSGVMCTPWNRMLVKKTKVYCVDAKTSPTNHDPVQSGQKFLTNAAGIYDRNFNHYNLNFNSGLVMEKMNKVVTIAVQGLDVTDASVFAANPEVEVKSSTFRHFYHNDFYRFKETMSMNAGPARADEAKVMFMEISQTHIRIFTNPSDDTNRFHLAQMQYLCQGSLLCSVEAFMKTSVKKKIRNKVDEISRKLPGVLIPFCKVLYFLDAYEGKRKIFLVCPATISNADVLETKYSAAFKIYLEYLRYNIEELQKHMPYALEAYPFKITVKNPSIEFPDPIEVTFKAQGIFKSDDDEQILLYDNCNCQVVVGLKDQLNCVRSFLDIEGNSETMELCVKSPSPLHAQYQALILAKKLGVDCSRFKDKKNDIESIDKMNKEMQAKLLVRHENADEIDGNKYEAFGKNPEDLRIPVMILSNEQSPDINNEQDTEEDEVSDQGEDAAVDPGSNFNVEKTDIDKGMFSGKGFGGELGNQYSKDAVDIKMDPNEMVIGENIQEKLENLVWPCRESKDPCKPEDFFKSKGYEATYLDGKRKEWEKFKADTGTEKDDLCVIVTFWQNRIFPICFSSEQLYADFIAVIVKNFSAKMENRKISPMEVNRKPFDGYKFAAKVLKDGIIITENLQVKKTGILKNDGSVLLEYSKIQDNCTYYYRYGKINQPQVLGDQDYKCCMRFKYDTAGEFTYVCMNAPNRCQISLKWFIKNSYFYCTVSQDTSSFDAYPNDPSIGDYPVTAAAPAPQATLAANTNNTGLRSNPLSTTVDIFGLDSQRENDWAFHFFKQTAAQPSPALEPEKCKKHDGVHFFDFVRGWYFDTREGESMVSDQPQLLRVIDDDICMCPQCREGFESPDYKDETCTCWKLHNMVFKCSQKYDVCTYPQFVSKLGNYKEYFKQKMLVTMGMNSDPRGLKKENCLFLQFQNMFKFKEMYLCTYGEKALEEAKKLKELLNKSYPKVTDKSQVHFERPLLGDGAISKVMIWNKTDGAMKYDGEVRFEDTQLVEKTSGNALIKYKDIKTCAVQYKNQIFPNLNDFKTIPWAACCFTFTYNVSGNDKQYFMCHRDPWACIVPSRRVMYKLRSKCKGEFGKTIREYFNYSVSDYTKGFWRSYAYILESSEFDDPAAIPRNVIPKYIEIDKGREVRHIAKPVEFLKEEEKGGQNLSAFVGKTYNFRYLEIISGTYHPLTPSEYEVWHTNKRKTSVDPAEQTRCGNVLTTLGHMVDKLKETYQEPEHCFVVDYVQFDQNSDRNFVIFCPYVATDITMYKFKWAFTIAYNYYMINSDQYSFPAADEKENFLVLLKTPTMLEKETPLYVKYDPNTYNLIKVDGGSQILNVQDHFMDNAANATDSAQMCKMKIRDIEVPEEFLSAGYKFESYCCVLLKTCVTDGGATKCGPTTICNVDKPRCWFDIRKMARLMRRECLKKHLANQSLPVDSGLQAEKYPVAAAAAAAAPAAAAPTVNTYDTDYVKSATELKTMCAFWMVSESYTATKVLRKLEIKQINGKWAMIFDDPATPITDPQEKEEMTMYLSNFFYPCKSKPNSCNIKEFQKVIGKYANEANMAKFALMAKDWKQKFGAETLDKAIAERAVVFQTKRHASHSTKTFLFAPANKDKMDEIEAFIHEKYMATVIGDIREKIWTKANAIGISEKDSVPAIYFEVQAGKAKKYEEIELTVHADGIYNKHSGLNVIPFTDVQLKDALCKIEFNQVANPTDLTALVDGIKDKLCCVNITMPSYTSHLCASTPQRCQFYTNKIVKTSMVSCNAFKEAEAKLKLYKENPAIVKYEYMAYDYANLYKGGFFKHMRLAFDTITKAEGVNYEGYVYVSSVNQNNLNCEHSRLYLQAGVDKVNFYFDKEMTKLMLSHDIATYYPKCDTICTTDEWLAYSLAQMSEETRKLNASDLHFKHKIMQLTLKRMEIYDTKSNNKLLTITANKGQNCGVMTFQEIGTYTTYEYYVCTDDMTNLRAVLKKTLKHKSLEGASDPVKIRQNFNEFFMDTEAVSIKINKLARNLNFGKKGLYIEYPDKQEYIIEYSGINRGARHEACPVWYQVVEKHLAKDNNTKNPECCFKTAYKNGVTVLCVDEDLYADTCHWMKMRTVVTFKNHCLAYVEAMDAANAAAMGGARKAGGYNPLVPNVVGGFIGEIHIGKFEDILELFNPADIRKFKATPRDLSFNYSFNGKSMQKVIESANADVILYAEAEKHFSGEQVANFKAQAQEIVAKMNINRNSIERPNLLPEDCMMVRHLNKDSVNFENFLLCPNDVSNTHILYQGITDSIYVNISKHKDFRAMPEVFEGEKFNISVNGKDEGEAEIKEQKLKWTLNGNEVIDAASIETVRGRKCAYWIDTLFVDQQLDGNCCFAVVVGGTERLVCEVSTFCIVRAMKIMKTVNTQCMGSEGGEAGFTPKYVPKRPLYKNKDTKNYGWDIFLTFEDELRRQEAANGGAGGAEAAAAAAAAEAEAAEANMTPEEKKAAEAAAAASEELAKSLDPRVDRHLEGKWRSKVWYYQLEDLQNEVKPENLVILEIFDRLFTIKPDVISKQPDFIESTMTSMWKIDCPGQFYPCLAPQFLEEFKPAKEKMMDEKVNKYLQWLESAKEAKYALPDCLVIQFHGSLLSQQKRIKLDEGGDNITTSLICPELKEDTEKIQKAFLHAFNHAMYMIDPTKDLPDAADGQEFMMDVWRGGDKLEECKVTAGETDLKIEGPETVEFPYDNVLSCKLVYVLKKDEIPDTDYKNKTGAEFYLSNTEAQGDCCVFYKLLEEVELDGEKTKALNNMYMCSKDEKRCMYNALMVAKQIQNGCEEMVNKYLSEHSGDPQWRAQTDATSLQSKHNDNPTGYKWVDEEGWVSLDETPDYKPGPLDINFCHDARRFRQGAWKRFLHGEINPICL